MALVLQTFNIGALEDSQAGGKNYISGKVYNVYNENDTLADIYSDINGATPIAQDGIQNVSNSWGEVNFYIESGNYYITVDSRVRDFTAGLDFSKSFNVDAARYLTLAQAQASDLKVGQYVRLVDRSFGLFILRGAGLTTNGYDIIVQKDGKSLQYTPEEGVIHIDHLGAIGDDSTNSTAPIQAAVDLAVSSSYKHKIQCGAGIYVLNDTIDFHAVGSPSGISFEGVGAQSESASRTSTAFKWIGANNRPVFKALGNAIRGLKFKGFLVYADGTFEEPTTPMKDVFHVGPTSGFAAFGIRFEDLWVRGFIGAAFKLGDPEGSTYNGQMAGSSMSNVVASGYQPDAKVIWGKGGSSEDFYVENLYCSSVSGNDKKCFIQTESNFYINIDGLLTDGIDETDSTAYAIKAKSAVSVYQWVTEDMRVYETYFQRYDHPIVIKGLRMLSSASRHGGNNYDAIVWRGYKNTEDPWQSEAIMEVTGSTLNGNILWEGTSSFRSHLKTGGLAFAPGSGIVKNGGNFLRGSLENVTNGVHEQLGTDTSLIHSKENREELFSIKKGAIAFNRNTKPETSGGVTSYTLGDTGSFFRMSGTGGAHTIQGFSDGWDGRYVILANTGSVNNLIIAHNSGSAPSGEAVYTSTGSDYILEPNKTIQMIYDAPSSVWRMLS